MNTKTRLAASRKRSLAKTITWRILATLGTFGIAWALTGNISFGLAIGGLDALIKTVLYYVHERAWERTNYGLVNVRGK